MCFITLQKACDSVDRELLRVVHALVGVKKGRYWPLSVSSTTACQLACLWMTVGTLEWFDGTQGLRQGGVLSPLLLNVILAAPIHVVLVRFRWDPDILRDLVHLEEDLG